MTREKYYKPSEDIRQSSNLKQLLDELGIASYEELCALSNEDPDWFWDMLLKWQDVRFITPYEKIRDTSKGPQFTEWCAGGSYNLVSSCLEKQLEKGLGEKEALVAVDEAGHTRSWSFQKYSDESCKIANYLKELGIRKGDRVAIFMPMIPEMAAAFMAIARIGATAIPLFSGFAANAIQIRLNDADVKVVLTASSTSRAGRRVDMLPNVLEAAQDTPTVTDVLCLVREWDQLPAHDLLIDWETALAPMPTKCPIEPVGYHDPLFVAFTSGTTGKPKGVVQNHIGIQGKIITDFVLCLDMKETDRHLWMTDMGWVMGPLTLVGTAMTGATLILAEGAPTTQDVPFRMLELIDQLSVTHMGIAPTVARQFMTLDQALLEKLSLKSLRIVPSTGEAWTPEAWYWVRDNICRNRAVPLNMSGGTELVGAILSSTVLQDIPPCGFSGENPGVGAKILRSDGSEADIGEVGELVMTNVPMGVTVGLWKDNDRYLNTYWSTYPDIWHHGDWAHKNADGSFHIHGRSDDTINVAGKRVGPPEIEGALEEHALVTEAAAVAVPDDIKGVAVVCFCTVKEDVMNTEAVLSDLRGLVAEKVGKPFAPREIYFVGDLPKTRSMKIMRRVIRAIYMREDPGDLSSLANPNAVNGIEGALN